MARYYFHIRKGDLLDKTTEATDVRDSEALADEATEMVRDLLAEGDLAGLDRREWIFTIRDESDQLVLTFPFKDAVEPDLPDPPGEAASSA